MNCPIDNTPLAITERQGIELDYCPKCRGVWLDRGELDKLIERNAQYNASYGLLDNDDAPLPAQNQAPYPAQQVPPSNAPQQAPFPQQQAPFNRGSDLAGMALDLIQKGLDKRGQSGSYGHGDTRGRKKRGGLLGELFDF